MAEKPPVPINALTAQDFYADAAAGWQITMGANLRIQLVALRVDHSGTSPVPVAVGHLVMPIEAARGMATALVAFFNNRDQMMVAIPDVPETMQ